jgi:hypothetical protein
MRVHRRAEFKEDREYRGRRSIADYLAAFFFAAPDRR